MDQQKLITTVKEYPSIWNRANLHFRDKENKDKDWITVANLLGHSVQLCQDTFKSLREKYIREREKSFQPNDSYREWDLLPHLKFLEPNIVPRKQSMSSEDDAQTDEFRSKLISRTYERNTFDKTLVGVVKQTTPIWNRNCNAYPNKQLKTQLWETIAQKLGSDASFCMLRWKALREKYIRQKTKYNEVGVASWYLLDDMNFLDQVILYRRKFNMDSADNSFNNSLNSSQTQTYAKPGEVQSSQIISMQHFAENLSRDESNSQSYIHEPDTHLVIETQDDNSLNEFNNDFVGVVKEEKTVLQMADSSFCGNSNGSVRRRSASVTSDEVEKKAKIPKVEDKTSEQLFGDLVAAMLTKKPERERSLTMVEIMTVLSK